MENIFGERSSRHRFEICQGVSVVYSTLLDSRLLNVRKKKTPSQRDHVLARQADAHFEAGRFIQAAQCYAQSSKSFEEVTLRFIDANEREALRYYLISRLERTRKTVRRLLFLCLDFLLSLFRI